MKTSIRVALLTFVIAVICNVSTASATPTNKYLKYYDDRHTEYVSAEIGLNVRRQPTTEASIVTTLNYSDEVEVLSVTEEDENWSAIYIDKSVRYVNNNYLTKDKPAEPVQETYKETTTSSEGVGDYLGTLRLTAYEHDGTLCANGNYPSEWWTCASNELPFGTIVFVEGYGEFIVEDTGGFGYGALDLFLGDPAACEEFGVQYADVWVVRYGY